MEIICAAWGMKERNTVHHWGFHVVPSSRPGSHRYRNLATGTKKPGHHKEQEVQFLCLCFLSLVYSISPSVYISHLHFFFYVFSPHSSYLFFCFSLSHFYALSHSSPLFPSLTYSLCNPLSTSLALILALPRLLLTQRTETTGEVFLSPSLSLFFFLFKSVCGVKSSCGPTAAAGKIHSRNVGQSDLESERRTQGQKGPALAKTDLVISRKTPSFRPVLKHSCQVRRTQMPQASACPQYRLSQSSFPTVETRIRKRLASLKRYVKSFIYNHLIYGAVSGEKPQRHPLCGNFRLHTVTSHVTSSTVCNHEYYLPASCFSNVRIYDCILKTTWAFFLFSHRFIDIKCNQWVEKIIHTFIHIKNNH